MYLLLFNLALWVLVVVCGSSSLTRDQTQTPLQWKCRVSHWTARVPSGGVFERTKNKEVRDCYPQNLVHFVISSHLLFCNPQSVSLNWKGPSLPGGRKTVRYNAEGFTGLQGVMWKWLLKVCPSPGACFKVKTRVTELSLRMTSGPPILRFRCGS